MLNNLQTSKLLNQFSLSSLFYSLIATIWLRPEFNTVLTYFDGNQLGEASLTATDIPARVSGVYLFVFSIIIIYSILAKLFKLLHKKAGSLNKKLENSLLGIGCIQAAMCIFKPELSIVLIFPVVFHVGFWISFLHRSTSDKETLVSNVAFAFIIWLLFIWFCPIVLHPIFHFVILLSALICCELIWRFLKIENLSKFNNAFAIVSLLPFLSIESNYFFREKLSLPISGLFSSIIIFTILLLIAIIIARKQESSNKNTRPISWLLIACGMGIQTYYNPYGIASSELFELANRATPLMEFHFFQNLPLIQKASSHMVSDYGFGLIYQFLYGYHGLDFMIFDIFDTLAWIILSFILIFQITKNKLVAFYFVAFFPFFDSAITPYYAWAFLPLIILIQAFKTPTNKWAWLFGISFTLLFPWRADLSFAMLISISGIIGIGLYARQINFKFLIPTFISLALLGISLLSISIAKHIDWINSLKCTIDYLQSSQSYGLTNIGDQNSNQFILHHFLIPITVVFVGYFSLVNSRNNFKSENASAFIAIVYLSIFYLINLPRGIVRHGFAEGFDNFLDSYGPIVLILWFSITFIKKKKIQLWSALIAITIFQLFLRFPSREPENTLAYASLIKPINLKNIPFKHQSQRLKLDSVNLQNKLVPLVNFLRQSLNDDETFIDFGNTPMLYFYAEKQIPAFFYQSPQNVHSITLQKDWLHRLQDYKVPLFLFRHHPAEWWDATDGVPNELRHYLIAEYAYQNYFPWQHVAGYEIWKLKTSTDTLLPEFMGPRLYEYYNLQKLPAIWNESHNNSTQTNTINDTLQVVDLPFKKSIRYELPKFKPTWLELKINNKSNSESQVRVTLMEGINVFGGYDFTLNKNSTGSYNLRLSIAASWWLVNIDNIRISLPEGALLEDVIFASESR